MAITKFKKSIAIDFDGVLFTDEYPRIGAPIWSTITLAKHLQSVGCTLILWTCREGYALDSAIDACSRVGLVFDYVNNSPDDRIAYYNNNPRKIGCDEFWDDKAVTMPLRESDAYWVITQGGVYCTKCKEFSRYPSKHCPCCDARMVNAHCIT